LVSQSPFGVNHQPESRMREIRTYGSEGGAAGQPVVPTPITRLSLRDVMEERRGQWKPCGESGLTNRLKL